MMYSEKQRGLGEWEGEPSWNEVEQEIVKERAEAAIKLQFDLKDLTKSEKMLLDQVMGVYSEAMQDWQEGFVELSEKLSLSENMKEFIRERKMDLPELSIYRAEEGTDFVKNAGFDHVIEDGNFLLVFKLPKQLDQYWWKGGIDTWKGASKDVRGMVKEWGYIYRALIPYIWRALDYMPEGLYANRINPEGIHERRVYYYLHEVGMEER